MLSMAQGSGEEGCGRQRTALSALLRHKGAKRGAPSTGVSRELAERLGNPV